MSQQVDPRADALAQVPLFAELPPEARARLETAGQPRTLEPGDLEICNPDCVYVVLNGGVKVIAETESGDRFIESVVDADDYFGWLAGPEPDHRVVEALEATTLLQLPRAAVWGLVLTHQALAVSLVRDLGTRQRRLQQRLESLAFRTVPERIVEAMLTLGRPDTEARGWTVDARFTRQDIADLVGSTRETVSRFLTEMQRRDCIQREGRSLRIPNRARLRREARSRAG